MDNHIITMLAVFGNLKRILKQYDEIIKNKSRIINADMSASEQCKIIAKIINQKQRLLELYFIVDDFLNKLTDKEALLIKGKYINQSHYIKCAEEAGVKIRAYYRKINNIKKEVNFYFNSRGYTRDWFFQNYSDINFMMTLFNRADCAGIRG